MFLDSQVTTAKCKLVCKLQMAFLMSLLEIIVKWKLTIVIITTIIIMDNRLFL